MLGLDGKPVIGPDGNFVMMQDGRPVKREEVKKEEDDVEEGSSSAKPKEPAPKKRKPFQKKTRQIHTIPEEQRQLQREERYPWVLEDQSGQETWVGRIENAEKSSMYGLFLTSTSTEFYFIPAHRWYKMQKRPNTKTATMEEVEAEVITRRVCRIQF
ncbi:Rap30/74 interaction domain-containing protein [Exidia glandulosa HHB12029]|uniref:Transcription initiation factor IIF subunit alpha n=1 Tax=Exidia glandulosa HHB12029 TaxID=1314781 RepID=A0A165L252_EXIGL|nr:Rap30/74 interaction domain-containing protein [Exidia glandulosa HHB12029]